MEVWAEIYRAYHVHGSFDGLKASPILDPGKELKLQKRQELDELAHVAAQEVVVFMVAETLAEMSGSQILEPLIPGTTRRDKDDLKKDSDSEDN